MGIYNFRNQMFDFYRRDFDEYNIHFVAQLGIYVILYCEEGYISVTVNNKNFLIHSGEFLFLPNRIKNITYRCYCTPHHLSYSFGFRSFPSITDFDYPTQIVLDLNGQLKKYMSEIPLEQADENHCAVTWKFYRFLTFFHEQLSSQIYKHFDQIKLAVEYMQAHDIYDVATLARHCGMSVTRFHVAFREVTGTTPLKMKHSLQMFKAEMFMSSTDLSIEEIAQQVGFSDIDYFRKIFKRHYSNKTPRVIRKERYYEK